METTARRSSQSQPEGREEDRPTWDPPCPLGLWRRRESKARRVHKLDQSCIGATIVKRAKYDRERLLFRRQFILGRTFQDSFPLWKRLDVRPGICLTVHPDLPALQVRDGRASVTLLGYTLDPYDPAAGDAEILSQLLGRLQKGGTLRDVIRATDTYGGRWIIIADDGHSTWLFNDPCGYRQVVYTGRGTGDVWCASQPGLLAKLFDLPVDEEAWAFIRSFRERELQYWWPADTTLYGRVRQLLPNHYLDLETGVPHRHWPDRDLPVREAEEVVVENAQLLTRLIEGASRRFELALTLTAGRDTRLLLAASKSIRDRLYCFTGIYWEMDWNHRDIRISSSLLSRIDMPHHVIRCPPRMDREFKEIYRANVTTAHDLFGNIAQGWYNQYPQGKVCMKGTANPITKCPFRGRLRRFRPDLTPEDVDATTLAHTQGMVEEFAVKAYDRWLSEAKRTGVNVLDLLYWEDREGQSQSMWQLEGDIAQEVFVPYNCRRYLTNALAVPEPDRRPPDHRLLTMMVDHLWPELLSEPFNPPHTYTVVTTATRLLEEVSDKLPWLTASQYRYRYRWLREFGEFRWGGLFYAGLHIPFSGIPRRYLPQ